LTVDRRAGHRRHRVRRGHGQPPGRADPYLARSRARWPRRWEARAAVGR